MSTALSRTTLPKKATKAPSPGSLLISVGSDSIECGLCGNSFDGEASESTRIEFPCDDSQCEPCGRMWRILSSPTCLTCYGGFTCPRLPRDQTEEMISDPGSTMRGEHKEAMAVSELTNDDLREALTLANNRVNTNFNFQEILAETPLSQLRTCTKLQLAEKLTRFCISKASDSDDDEEMKEEEEAGDESSQQPEGNDLNDTMPWFLQQPQETAETDSRRCIHCGRTFGSVSHLRQHVVVHSMSHRTCSICGKVLGTSSSRRVHESKHRETDSERDERRQKAKVSRERSRTGQKIEKQKRRERLPQILG